MKEHGTIPNMIKHFQVQRKGKIPSWKTQELLLIGVGNIQQDLTKDQTHHEDSFMYPYFINSDGVLKLVEDRLMGWLALIATYWKYSCGVATRSWLFVWRKMFEEHKNLANQSKIKAKAHLVQQPFPHQMEGHKQGLKARVVLHCFLPCSWNPETYGFWLGRICLAIMFNKIYKEPTLHLVKHPPSHGVGGGTWVLPKMFASRTFSHFISTLLRGSQTNLCKTETPGQELPLPGHQDKLGQWFIRVEDPNC